MAIFRPGVRQGALAASRQGTLGSFLGAHPRAQQQWNQAARAGSPRQGMLGTRNANAQLTLGQASGGRPMPFTGSQGGGGGGGGQTPAPPTVNPPPPGADYRGPNVTTLGGQPGFSDGGPPQLPNFGGMGMPGLNAGGYGYRPYQQPYGGGNAGQYVGGAMGNYGGAGYGHGPVSPGDYTSIYGNQALQGLMGSVNPGMQSVIGSRLGWGGAMNQLGMQGRAGGSMNPSGQSYGGPSGYGNGGGGMWGGQMGGMAGGNMQPFTPRSGGYLGGGISQPDGGMQQPSYRQPMTGGALTGYGYGAGNAGQPMQRWQQLGATPM